MIEKLITRFMAEAAQLFWNTFSYSLLFVAILGVGFTVYRAWRREFKRPAVLEVMWVITLAGLGSGVFLYLTASTTSRRAYINIPMYELSTGLGEVIVGALLALGIALGIMRLAQWRRGIAEGIVHVGVGIGVLGYLLFGSTLLHFFTFTPDLDELRVSAPAISQITVVDNVPIRIYEDRYVKQPTALEVGHQGEVYVAGIGGQIWVMRDVDHDGGADEILEFASGLKQPEGLAWSSRGLYVTVLDKVLLLIDSDGDFKSDHTQVIAEGFPGETYAFHQSNGLTFGVDGRLYIGVGSTTDHRPESHPLAAKILSVNPDGSDLRTYATGVRNPYGLIPAPDQGLFAVDNGSSGCLDTPIQIDDCSHKIDVPEELNYIVEDQDYGFPTYFGIPSQDSGTMPPIVTFPDHSAPAGLEWYSGHLLPEKYVDQLFVSLWALGEIHSVRVFRTDEQHFVGSSRLFASGIPGPSAIVNSPDGGLLVASFSGNAIYHIGIADGSAPQAEP